MFPETVGLNIDDFNIQVNFIFFCYIVLTKKLFLQRNIIIGGVKSNAILHEQQAAASCGVESFNTESSVQQIAASCGKKSKQEYYQSKFPCDRDQINSILANYECDYIDTNEGLKVACSEIGKFKTITFDTEV